MLARFAFVVCALGLLAASGCGPAKLNQTQTLALDSGDTKSIDLDAQPKPQTITVEYSSSAGEVSAFVFKEADAKGEEGLLNASINKAKALAAKKSKGETFSVDVPENTAVRVIFTASTKTDVTVKLTNK